MTDAPRVKVHSHIACALAVLLLVLAAAPAAVLAEAGDVGTEPLSLEPIEQEPVAVGIDQTAALTATDPAAAPTTDGAATGDLTTAPADPDLDPTIAAQGTDAQLAARRAQLVVRRNAAQDSLLRLEAKRSTEEDALDLVLTDYATRIADLYDAGGVDRLSALMASRNEADPATRAALVAALVAPDRELMERETAARAAVAAAATAADAQRDVVLQLGTTIGAIGAAIDGRAATAAAGTKPHAASEPIDPKYIFASGPIPGIGYWGAVNGDSGMLGGWPSFASAAMGGVGCSAPSPELRATGRIEQGEASWYGPDFNGKNTSSGEVYDQEALTAAHPSLPFGTIVRVTSSTTGQCVFLRINDRGPFVAGRIIDLSHAGATAIGMSGTAPVQLEVWAAPGTPVPDIAPTAPSTVGATAPAVAPIA